MSDELKACPFCGGSVETREDGTPRPVLGVLVCQGCTAGAEPQDWNRRTVTREQYEEMVYELHSECRDLNYKQTRAATEAMLRAAWFEVADG